MFPSWFAGVAFSAIVIGALVPAAIMAIAAANLFTRNIFKEFFKPDASPRLQTKISQWTSLVVKFGALLFAVELPRTFSINLQLLGGVWILQVFPSIVFGLFTRWFHRWALLAGWLAGMIFGTIAAYKVATPTTSHWAGSTDLEFGHTVYIGLTAIILNIAVSVILTLIFKAARVPEGADETLPHQYLAEQAEAPAPAPASASAGLGTAGTAGSADDLKTELCRTGSGCPAGPANPASGDASGAMGYAARSRSGAECLSGYRLVTSPPWHGYLGTAGRTRWRWRADMASLPCSRCRAGTCSRCTTRW
jgi:SSS family solute:Na+ symporter